MLSDQCFGWMGCTDLPMYTAVWLLDKNGYLLFALVLSVFTAEGASSLMMALLKISVHGVCSVCNLPPVSLSD